MAKIWKEFDAETDSLESWLSSKETLLKSSSSSQTEKASSDVKHTMHEVPSKRQSLAALEKIGREIEKCSKPDIGNQLDSTLGRLKDRLNELEQSGQTLTDKLANQLAVQQDFQVSCIYYMCS